MAVRRHRARTLLAGVLTALALSTVLFEVTAVAATAGYCPDTTGVTVVVDFHELGGGVVVRCAPGEQTSGLTALQNAGFTVAGTNRWGLALICRINGEPTAAIEPCADAPPMTAYWSYWHAPDGGAWTSSEQSAKDRVPPQGSFEGWSFSGNHADGAAPRPGAAPSRPVPAPSLSTTAPPVDVSATRTAAGVPAGTLAGVAVLVVLAAAGVVAWRRRSTRDA